MKRYLLILICLVAVGWGIWCRNGDPRLTTSRIISVRPGMTMEQVRAILGEPLDEDSTANYRFYCRCNAERVCTEAYHYTWKYTSARGWYYPMLWVHFNDRKRVRQVYAKEYMIMDDRGSMPLTEIRATQRIRWFQL